MTLSSENVVAASFEVRDLRFDTGEKIPRHWHPAGASVTRFFDNFSLFFPDGERFFVEAVKAHRDQVSDPRLAADLRAFIGQEAMHTREHIRYNQMLAQQGLPARRLEERVRQLLRFVSRRNPPRTRLAITAALEHFTALLAQMLLARPAVLDGAHPTMARLWRWHALEEAEHKAVAFDIYRQVGGPYLERVAVMIGATLIFWAKVIQHQICLMRADGILFSWREWKTLLRFLFVAPGALRGLLRPYLAYYHPQFHPNQVGEGIWSAAAKPPIEMTAST